MPKWKSGANEPGAFRIIPKRSRALGRTVSDEFAVLHVVLADLYNHDRRHGALGARTPVEYLTLTNHEAPPFHHIDPRHSLE
jgi:transposase InsO family protein